MGDNKLDAVDKMSACHERCRVCGKDELIEYLDLGNLPLANNLESTSESAMNKERFPLQVMFCENCGLSQLSEVINPVSLYRKYSYRSSISNTYVEHCKEMAKDFKKKRYLSVGSSADLIVDIAGNDGTLLKQFKNEFGNGLRLLNIDPSVNMCELSRSVCESWSQFLNINTGLEVLKSKGVASVITATNVFCHVDNVREFILSCKIFLAHNGVLVLEFPYLSDFIVGLEYPTIYHEHLSYMGIIPLKKLCDETGMKIIAVEHKDIHCGTVRVSIVHSYSNREIDDSVYRFISNEISNWYDSIEKYQEFGHSVNFNIVSLKKSIGNLLSQGKTIGGFGASAKGNTLLNVCGFTSNEIGYIIDDTPEKQGMFSPGTGIPIVSIETLQFYNPDYLIILAWNFKDEIIERLKGIYNGSYIIPIPEVEIIQS